MKSKPTEPSVKTFKIVQATTHRFRDLYIYNTMLVLVEAGAKSVRPAPTSQFDVLPGELLIFPSGKLITIENRIISGSDYRAWCVSYPDELVESVFGLKDPKAEHTAAINVGHCPERLAAQLRGLEDIQAEKGTPAEIIEHRLREPLVWLKSMGLNLATPKEKTIDCQIRDIISADPSHKWRSADIASSLGMSEPTLRRRLQEQNTTFSTVLMNVRLEHGLTMLQTTTVPISQIAMECGFATPSHFSDSFKARFELSPKGIRKPID